MLVAGSRAFFLNLQAGREQIMRWRLFQVLVIGLIILAAGWLVQAVRTAAHRSESHVRLVKLETNQFGGRQLSLSIQTLSTSLHRG